MANSVSLAKKIFTENNSHFQIVFKKSAQFIFALHLIASLSEQFIFRNSTTDEDRITFGIIGIFLSFFEVTLSFLIMSYALSDSPDVVTHTQRKFKDLVIETLRGVGHMMVGLVLFWTLIPRIFKYFFIPYIVVFDPDYANGQVDVLEEAKSLIKNNFLLVLVVTVLTQVVVWGIDITALKYNVFTDPEIWFLIFVLEVLVSIYIFSTYMSLYRYLKDTKEIS